MAVRATRSGAVLGAAGLGGRSLISPIRDRRDPPMNPSPAPPPAHQPAGYVDGGSALVRGAYSSTEWAQVREGWWWHVVAMVLVPPYAVVALTVWQRPSGQPLLRRVGWATLAAAGALLVVGLPAFVLFSRRWYWWHRMGASPEAVAASPAVGGPLALRAAAAGERVVDAVAGTTRRAPAPGHALPLLDAPWGQLRDRVAVAALRVRALRGEATGPVTAAVARAEQETSAAFLAASRVAGRAARAQRANRAVERAGLVQELARLSSAADGPSGVHGDADDLAAAVDALEAQLAVADRVTDALEQLEGQLHRLAAQAGEAAARAEELVWCPSTPLASEMASLVAVTDELTAIREALDAVSDLDVALAATR
jgi:hypothetical protein